MIKHVRNIIYILSFLTSLGIFFYTLQSFEGSLQIIRLTQIYAFVSVGFLYSALLASPLYSAFPNIRLKAFHIKARKALGLSAFYFALLHASITFFKQFGGFEGLFFLGNTYLFAVSLSFIALIILSILAITSHNYFIVKLGKHWKIIHRSVYIASILIIIHALLIGTHFSKNSYLTYQISLSLVTVLILLEALRFNKYISNKFEGTVELISRVVMLILICLYIIYFYIPLPMLQNLNIHNH